MIPLNSYAKKELKGRLTEMGFDAYIRESCLSVFSSNGNSFYYVFMPIHSYPYVYGLELNSEYGEIYNPFFYPSLLENALICLYVGLTADYHITVSLSETLNISLISEHGRTFLHSSSGQKMALNSSERLVLGIRKFGGSYYCKVNDSTAMELREILDLQAECVSVRAESGICHVAQVQALNVDDSDFQLRTFTPSPDNRKISKVESSSPHWVLVWEKQSKFYYDILIGLLYSKILFGEDLSEEGEQLCTLVDMLLCNWPYWRPSSGLTPGSSDWDRNNWSNGYLPGALAVSSYLLNIVDREKKKMVSEKGGQWLSESFSTEDKPLATFFPGVKHWLNRSTNHGISIYASYLVGALVLGDSHQNWPASSAAAFSALSEILETSLVGRVYLEGLSYLQFNVSNLIPLYFLINSFETSLDPDVLVASFESAKQNIYWSSASNGRPLATFGDSKPLYFKPILLFLNSFSSFACLDLPLEASTRRSFASFQHYPVCLLSFNDNRGLINSFGEIKPSNLKEMFCDKSWMAALKSESQAISIWILGSKAHMTHNKDQDCGSFFVEKDGKTVVAEGRGRGAIDHNTWVSSSLDLRNDIFQEKFKSNGVPADKRIVNGKIVRSGDLSEILVYSVLVPPSKEGHGLRHAGGVRKFVIAVDKPSFELDKVFIFDRIKFGNEDDELFSVLHFPTGEVVHESDQPQYNEHVRVNNNVSLVLKGGWTEIDVRSEPGLEKSFSIAQNSVFKNDEYFFYSKEIGFKENSKFSHFFADQTCLFVVCSEGKIVGEF
ncbi:hypothetical protein [Marinobacter orientalis]|uniref:Uncharacterized protein n=1 Tax=Marinobacter orientalis TaxID=1928859 RepID=A0A7Y0RFD4_9GAMM|nr:hypothetical protein [Marinobacter orientalis]NMT65220.1 hypothetical protein [Marinobacter orientalis]TGX48010.1 hypothetical protein DIT72_16505 [Marinobacter orientalis]